VALVTGGNSGIGAATVALLKKQGAKVAIIDIAESASDASNNDLYIKCNVASQQEVEDSVAKVIEKFGHLDILVNCAGVMDGMGVSERISYSSTANEGDRENRRY
jgi:2-keto-3-deoxy-L-fuconate dehydrogenase